MIKLLLHAGCGHKSNRPPREFAAYKEVRLDCNKLVEPDVVASIVAMPQVDNDSFDAVFCSHVLEHLYAHEVGMSLAEFARVLKPGGIISIRCPDLQSIGGKLALDQADVMVYRSPMGPVSPLDMIYGHRASVGAGNLFMGHKTGFTQSVLKAALDTAGFVGVKIDRDTIFELNATARKSAAYAPDEALAEDCRLVRARIEKRQEFSRQAAALEAADLAAIEAAGEKATPDVGAKDAVSEPSTEEVGLRSERAGLGAPASLRQSGQASGACEGVKEFQSQEG